MTRVFIKNDSGLLVACEVCAKPSDRARILLWGNPGWSATWHDATVTEYQAVTEEDGQVTVRAIGTAQETLEL